MVDARPIVHRKSSFVTLMKWLLRLNSSRKSLSNSSFLAELLAE
jgi:hypothetical protein